MCANQRKKGKEHAGAWLEADLYKKLADYAELHKISLAAALEVHIVKGLEKLNELKAKT